ncbi:hypothetical protein J4434_08690 [Candidatus Woesearchaeota archaeon]|nr:hypothetical protein [Candidatus Woesearchaeota archaeon]
MRVEKHLEALKEVQDEIDSALKDPRGVVVHQRRLAFSLSLGACTLIELYFHKHNVIKEGAKIHHEWLKRKKETIFEQLQNQIVSPITSLSDIDKIIDLAILIEEKRDDLAYGSVASESILMEKINLFLKMKELVEC